MRHRPALSRHFAIFPALTARLTAEGRFQPGFAKKKKHTQARYRGEMSGWWRKHRFPKFQRHRSSGGAAASAHCRRGCVLPFFAFFPISDFRFPISVFFPIFSGDPLRAVFFSDAPYY